MGHLEWAICAAFGAFTSLYGRNHVHLSRLQMQLTLAVPVAAVAAGVASVVSIGADRHAPVRPRGGAGIGVAAPGPVPLVSARCRP